MEKEILNCKEKYPRRALLIINPVSGKKLVIRYIPEIIRRLMDSGYLVTTAVTSRRGEATEIAAQLGADYDLVCCTGGAERSTRSSPVLPQAARRSPSGTSPAGARTTSPPRTGCQ